MRLWWSLVDKELKGKADRDDQRTVPGRRFEPEVSQSLFKTATIHANPPVQGQRFTTMWPVAIRICKGLPLLACPGK